VVGKLIRREEKKIKNRILYKKSYLHENQDKRRGDRVEKRERRKIFG
jgi:hypothetical protein